MKRILCDYYSNGNFGDDLFILNLATYFSDDMVYVLGNPRRIPSDLPNSHLLLNAHYI